VNAAGEEDSGDRKRWADALAWHDTLQEAGEGNRSNVLPPEWCQWHSDAENQRIFDSVSRLLAERDLYRKRSRPKRGERKADRYDLSVPVAEWQKTRAPQVTRKQYTSTDHRARWLAGGFAVATVAAIAVMVTLWRQQFWRATGLGGHVTYRTSVGGLQDVHLPDGSTITLGGRTKLSVAFSSQRRSVTLIEGEAWFKVAHHPHWRFVVAAGGGTITDVGTAFVVTRENHRVFVTVTDGTVEVSTQKSQRAPRTIGQRATPMRVLTPIRITEGEELTYSDKGALSPVMHTDVHAATAWTHGRLTFDDESLRDVVAAVDRYSSRQITISQRAATLRFSGIVLPDEIDEWLQGLEKIFPVSIQRRGPAVCIDVRDLTPMRQQADTSCTRQPQGINGRPEILPASYSVFPRKRISIPVLPARTSYTRTTDRHTTGSGQSEGGTNR
jgi:ferric-dicitrate binding protein FerR (iron transport regulator)